MQSIRNKSVSLIYEVNGVHYRFTMSIKYKLLSDHSGDSFSIRRPFLLFITVVCFVLFFVLYIDSIPMVTISSGLIEPDPTARGYNPFSTFSTVSSNGRTLHQSGSTNSSISVRSHLSSNETASTYSEYDLIETRRINNSTSPNSKNSSLSSSTEYSTYDGVTAEVVAVEISTRTIPALDNIPVPTSVYNNSDAHDVYKKYAIYGAKCRIREYDYKEQAIKKKYFSGTPKMCPLASKPFVFYPKMNITGGFSCIGFDPKIFESYYKANFSQWNCTYKETLRNPKYQVIDRNYKFGEPLPLVVNSCPRKEFLWIECDLPGTKDKKKQKYEQPLMLPLVKPVRYPLRPNNVAKKPLHVLIVGLDSVSRLNAHRQFPKTIKFLQEKKNIVELYGYNKIGLNSAPNQIPLLTGIQYYPDPGLRSRIDNTYFDNVTRFLWDDYEERGYRTMFYEEQWNYGLFVYPSLRGFKKVPTTYWSRPMMQAIDKSTLKGNGSGWCIGPDFPAKHYLDYTYNTMKILGEDRPLFSYSWLSETAHDDVNGGHRVDKYFEDFFVKMDRDGILNTTAVLFISDHGFRFGSFRTTAQGRYEDMLPYGFILLPDSYYNENPEALANIKANSRRLVTVYDLHATLLELADMWSEGRVTRTANGYSLLSNIIPDDRTCEDADIEFQFCSCYEPQPYDRKGELAVSLAQFVLNSINQVVRKNNATTKCHEWVLRSIDDFTRLSEGEQWTNIFKISISTKPSGQFEVAGRYMRNADDWTLLADVDRTDWFSAHAKCVKGSNYERYCYCRQ